MSRLKFVTEVAILLLLSALFLPKMSIGQRDSLINIHIRKQKALHQFSFSFSNDIYFPEKIIPSYGVLRLKPFAKYSYKIEVNYAFETKIGVGVEFGVAQGFIPFGTRDNSAQVFNDNTILPNGYRGNPFDAPKDNQLNVFYIDFPIKVFYTFKVNSKFLIRPKVGASFKIYPNYSVDEVWLNNNDNQPFSPNDIKIAYWYSQVYTKYQYFYPDLLVGIDFLIQPKKPNHFIKLGLMLNYGFVHRAYGGYEFSNMGTQYDAAGKAYYGSSYFGISIGYHFMKYNKWEENKTLPTENIYLFNPQF